MKFLNLENIIFHFKNAKLNTLLLFILLFSVLYMFLDDKHFSGVNFIKETIKEEVIKRKIEKKIKEKPETFYTIHDMKTTGNIEVELDKATEKVEKEIKEEELVSEKIEIPLYQKLFNRLYFSIITSTLLGYGDIYPVTNVSKIIVMIQSLLTVTLIVL